MAVRFRVTVVQEVTGLTSNWCPGFELNPEPVGQW